MRLDRESPDMLHEQLARQLRQQVRPLPEGTKIPTEQELATQYGLSRTTIRKAVDALVAEGILTRRRPKGTFVTAPRLRQSLDHIGAFLDTLSAGGRQPTPTLTTFTWIAEPEQLPAAIGEVTEALHFERLYTLDDKSCAFAQCYVAPPFAAQVSRGDLEKHPSYELFTHTLGLTIEQCQVTVRAINADADQATRLGIAPGDALLTEHRWWYAPDDQLVQYSIHYLPADWFELELKQPHPTDLAAPQPVLSLVPPVSDASA